ncbi:MAG: Rho termination factor N-terminal domain-containing protein [Acetobacterium wieringae]|nr:Rho termination factor N-terminal domain-containing protein [Acetobacterium wieringae]
MLYQNGPSLFDRLTEHSKVDIQTGAIAPIVREERVEYTMKIKMIKTVPGSLNGITIQTFDEGVEYDLPKELADAFILKGYAENLEAGPMEQKVIEPEENKHDELSGRTVDELKEIAKSMGIKGYTKLSKDELVQAIHEAVN